MYNLTADYVREVIHYDPDTGNLIWKHRKDKAEPWNARWSGKIAGCLRKDGYITIKLCDHAYRASRIAWLWMTGKSPAEQIDHVDMDRSNNKWTNLRQATRSENACNRKVQSNNKSGLKGAYWDKRSSQWKIDIRKGGERFCGSFFTPEDAHVAYCDVARSLFGEFARTS